MPVDDNIWNLNRYFVIEYCLFTLVTTEISYIYVNIYVYRSFDFDYIHRMYRQGHKYMIRVTNR